VDLARQIEALPVQDVIRVLGAAAHELIHRQELAGKPLTADEIAEAITTEIADLHRQGMP